MKRKPQPETFHKYYRIYVYIHNDNDLRQTAEADDLVILKIFEISKGTNKKIRTRSFVSNCI
jgi:hypothetical protein